MKVIGITGGIGSGKTVVTQIFEALGYPVYNSDLEAKRLVVSDKGVKAKIIELLGEESYLPNGSYNTKFVGKKVFSDAKLLARLNDIIHPAVKLDFKRWSDKQRSSLLIKESALLLDKDFSQELDVVIAVVASDETRVLRIKKRDPYRSEEQVMAILKKQGDWGLKAERADYLIENDEGVFLLPQVKSLLEKIL